MVNLSGVLCYMNSVLQVSLVEVLRPLTHVVQALASIGSLISHLERITALAVEADLPTPVSDALGDVLRGEARTH